MIFQISGPTPARQTWTPWSSSATLSTQRPTATVWRRRRRPATRRTSWSCGLTRRVNKLEILQWQGRPLGWMELQLLTRKGVKNLVNLALTLSISAHNSIFDINCLDFLFTQIYRNIEKSPPVWVSFYRVFLAQSDTFILYRTFSGVLLWDYRG